MSDQQPDPSTAGGDQPTSGGAADQGTLPNGSSPAAESSNSTMLKVIAGMTAAFLVVAVAILGVVVFGGDDESQVRVAESDDGGAAEAPAVSLEAGELETVASEQRGEVAAEDAAEPQTGDAAGALADVDLSGLSISVGSKDFDEQLILGNVLADAFEAAGADVTREVGVGDTNVVRQALLSGEIDSYAEYNGTGWTEHLGQEDPASDGEELTEKVRQMDRDKNDIEWVGRAPFNNTYGFATGPGITAKNGGAFNLDSMAEHLRNSPSDTVCMEAEFPTRSDGLVLFEEATGFDLLDHQRYIIDVGLIYTRTSQGMCDFGEVFTTDGRIPELDLTVVEDDGVMIIYNISINLRAEVYNEAPAAFEALAEAVLSPLDGETMASLNQQVSGMGEEPEDVARGYLVDQGLIIGDVAQGP